jgi:uncharacterized alkaline shock family protein YloU
MKQAKKTVKPEKEHQEKPMPELNFIEKANEFGKIKLTDSVLISVIKKAACNVTGVARLSGSSIMDNIASMISSQKIYDRSIAMKIRENGSLDIEAKINVSYGENIPNVAAKVQNTIRDEANNLLGVKVNKVNIIIQEIEYPNSKDDEAVDVEEEKQED